MCRSGCPTQDHASWGECFRAAGIEFGNPGQRKASRTWDTELAAYRKAREVDGLSPKTTKLADTQQAYRMADKGVFRS
jgi:hypothetical protein